MLKLFTFSKYTGQILALISLLTMVSCNQSVKKVKILPYEALHDNNSKVWILQTQKMNDQDVTPEFRSQKIVMTFFKDNTFMVQLISDFAYYSDNNGNFHLGEGGETITFEWKDGSKATYQILQLNENVLEYTGQDGNTKQYLKFIPLTKPTQIDQKRAPEAEINILG